MGAGRGRLPLTFGRRKDHFGDVDFLTSSDRVMSARPGA